MCPLEKLFSWMSSIDLAQKISGASQYKITLSLDIIQNFKFIIKTYYILIPTNSMMLSSFLMSKMSETYKIRRFKDKNINFSQKIIDNFLISTFLEKNTFIFVMSMLDLVGIDVYIVNIPLKFFQL